MEKKCLFDSSILIDALRLYPPAIQLLEHEDVVTISSVAEMELIRGCKDKRAVNEIQKLVTTFEIIHITPEISHLAVVLQYRYGKTMSLSVADALIAATALNQGYVLLTRNGKHFKSIQGLAYTTGY